MSTMDDILLMQYQDSYNNKINDDIRAQERWNIEYNTKKWWDDYNIKKNEADAAKAEKYRYEDLARADKDKADAKAQLDLDYTRSQTAKTDDRTWAEKQADKEATRIAAKDASDRTWAESQTLKNWTHDKELADDAWNKTQTKDATDKAYAKQLAGDARSQYLADIASQRTMALQDRDAEWGRQDAAAAKQDAIRAEEKAAAIAKETARQNVLAGKRVASDSNARASARSIVESKGIDWNTLSPQLTAEYDRIRDIIPEGEENPGSYYSPDIVNNLLSKTEKDRRSSYTGQVKNTFGSGYENTYIPDTADDSYIDKLLTSRQGDAQKSIDFARARGQLNDAGYSSAMGKLGEQSAAARSTLNSIGSSVLGTKRAGLAPIKDEAFNQASSYSLGDSNFDLQPYQERLTKASGDALGSIEGDITNALGNTSLFNVNDIILSGGKAQGPQNLTTAAVPGRLKKDNTDRGLGTTGTF